MTSKLYGVSSGNGNNGVSRMFADYYVMTDDPWRLAELAAISDMMPKWQAWAKENVEIDGEADYGITACLLDDPTDEPDEKGNMPSDFSGAWALYEVFPEDKPRDGTPVYGSIEECFEAADLALVPADKAAL